MEDIKQLKQAVDQKFDALCEYYRKNNVTVVMPTFYPQRGEILEQMALKGVRCVILGGKEGSKAFPHVKQYGLSQDTTGMEETDEQKKMLIERLPDELKHGNKIALHSYEQYSYAYEQLMKEKYGNLVDVVSCTGQNTGDFFEEKVNLTPILKAAGLEEHIIPNETIDVNLLKNNDEELNRIYDELRNEENGKIVVQICGNADHQEAGGGKSTYIINNLEEFKKVINEEINGGNIKIAKFIAGAESNLSFFCSNKKIGADGKILIRNNNTTKVPNVVGGEDQLNKLLQEGRDSGINPEDTYAINGKYTLKCVSCDWLTSSNGNGVGNDVGYIGDKYVREKVKNIVQKLGRLMAQTGKVGLAGCDLIIQQDPENPKDCKVYINEINNRQQGPTEQMSRDAERNNIPSLTKMAFIMNHCPAKLNPQELANDIHKNSVSLSDAYLTNNGNFYIKLNSTHTPELQDNDGFNFKFRKNIKTGYYRFTRKDDKSEWKMSTIRIPSVLYNLYNKIFPSVDPTKNEIILKLDGVTKKDDKVDTKKQLLRIEGKAAKGGSPFLIEGGKTILNPKWEKIVTCIYDTLITHPENTHYQEFNPLYFENEWKKFEDERKKQQQNSTQVSSDNKASLDDKALLNNIEEASQEASQIINEQAKQQNAGQGLTH